MRHRVNKAKFGHGIDANRMMLRKLASNFIKSGKMVTTEKRAKALKVYIETLVHKSKKGSEANKNYLLNKLGSPAVMRTLYDQIAPATKEKSSGFVTLKRLHPRLADGASMTEIRWSMPIVMEENKEVQEKVEVQSQKVQKKAEVQPKAKKAAKTK